MKKFSLHFLPALIALTFAAAGSLTVATVVEAQTPPSQPGRPMPADGPMPMKHGDRGGPGEHGMHGPEMRMMRELEQFKAALQLNASQSALWDKAAAQMKPPMNAREEMKAGHDRMTAALADPNFDPRKLAAEMDRVDTERRARMSSIRDAWFTVYDSLNPAQRGQVREFLRERMSHRPGMHGGGWMHHGDGERRGMMPGKPMPDGGMPPR
jgi:Spy/CpxP family protein refolding chaperone